jgi:2-polyprenyl-6-hydroxyphenyl methylase/3-demethylubiquinone-9 3-methyltransferase
MAQDPTIDPDELLYYDRLAHQWWDEAGKFWPLHRLNRLRKNYLREHICRHFNRDPAARRPLAGLSIVDIGCGGGILSESMTRMGATVNGIDVVSKSLQIARLHCLEQGLDIDYRECTAEMLAAEGRQFDIVLNMEVVEHVADLPAFLASCTALQHDNGISFISTINRNAFSWLIAIIGAEYVLRWLPRGTHRWSRFVKHAELDELLATNGLRADKYIGVRINPFNRHFSLSGSLRVNYMLSATSTTFREQRA